MNVLIIGYGSIGQRHARILSELKLSIFIISQQETFPYPKFNSLKKAIQEIDFDYVIICNSTALHESTLLELKDLGYRHKILVEKPLMTLDPLQIDSFSLLAVGYNLRFHPLLQMLKKSIDGKNILSMSLYTGQYLPTWRPNRNHKKSYSAHKDQGGGVLWDLSHELDYLEWLVGPITGVFARGGKYGDITVDSDEAYNLIMEARRCPLISVELNYYDKIPNRLIRLHTSEHSYQANFTSSTLTIDQEVFHYPCQRDETYLAEHQAILNEDTGNLCLIEDAKKLWVLFDAITQSNETQQWIKI